MIGAKGSPLQLILSTVYHIDVPNGNIKLADAETAIGATKAKALASVKDIAGETAAAIVSALTNAGASKDEVDRALKAVGAEK